MNLFRYEMKKLLINKVKLLLLIPMLGFYVLLGAFLSMDYMPPESANEYAQLVSENSGPFNPEQLAESQSICDAAEEEYGIGLSEILHRDPILRFHTRYILFAQRVDQYWNGPNSQDKADIQGIYPIQEKLKELEAAGDNLSYEYKRYVKMLNTELAIGEPVYGHAPFWNKFFFVFEPIFLLILFLMALPFFISPIFTQEIKTEMDSIVLCTAKGRREIVTAKLLAAAATSAALASVYIIGVFIGAFIGCQNFDGFDVPARCLDALPRLSLNISALGAASLGSTWLILATTIFGLALAFVSTRTKNQSSAMGLGIVILIAGAMSSSFGDKFKELIWPIMDFNFGVLSNFMIIFSGHKTYNIFGHPASYGTVAFWVCIALGMISALLIYWAQKRRQVV